ncbi:EF-hand domain-containing protein [Zobellia alginiliquefaciens]|uniref:EF-hand domain-containing protein n=1 Tax=Zobellia alginiliquefaciens TaxID=3032586 RepID=UPI0023E43CCE|nr:EF-hand domain-containing protein [Zobellia alginiliquefaciens]
MKKSSFYTVIATAVLGLATIQTGYAQEDRKEPPSATELMEKMDANEDGKLSKDELKGPIKNDFDTIDKDEDGFLSLEELENAPKPKRRKK